MFVSYRKILGVFIFSTGVSYAADVTYDSEHLGYWLKTLKSNSIESVRKSAAKMLGSMGDKRALGALIEALKDPSAHVRYEAVTALGTLVDIRAIPALEDVSERDPDANVRRRAAHSLNMIQKRKDFDKAKRGGDPI